MTVLEGIRVLDLTGGIAPAIAGMLLADFGADVVNVLTPGDRETRRAPGFAAWDRGKRSVARDESASDWLPRMVSGADICIVRRTSDLDAYGPEVAEAAARNRRLITLEMPVYLPDGAPWEGDVESDALLAAHLGVAWRQASDDGAPVDLVNRSLLHVQAAWATTCVVSALLERESSGWGQTVGVSGTNAVMEAAVSSLTVDPNAPDPVTAIGGVGRHPTYRPVRAADGWLACGALGPKFEAKVFEILGLQDVLENELQGYTTLMLRPENAWVKDRISAAFATRPRDHWIEQLRANGIPSGPLLRQSEWLDHVQITANDLRIEVEDPERGDVVMPGVPFVLTGSPGAVRGPAPVVQPASEITPWPAQAAVPDGAAPLAAGPLKGVRVLNLGTFVATPYAGVLLAELGADVIKVEPLAGDPYRPTGFQFNRGMKSVAVDLSQPDGIEVVYRLLPSVDAVMDGMRPGVMTKLGIDDAALRAAKPDIVTLSLAAFGTRGPLAPSGGVDMVVQAMSGMMLAQGSDDAPVANTVAILDVTAAALNACAVVLALLHRARTGEGQRVTTSLIGTASFLCDEELVRYSSRPPTREGKLDHKGYGPLDHYYQARDGWIRVEAPEPSRFSVQDVAAAGVRVDELTVEAIGAAIAELSVVEAIAAFGRLGVPATTARKVSQLFRDADLMDAEFAHLRTSDDGTTIATTGRHARFGRTQRRGPMTPGGIGEQTHELLSQAGLEDEEIDALVARDIVRRGGRAPVRLGPIYR